MTNAQIGEMAERVRKQLFELEHRVNCHEQAANIARRNETLQHAHDDLEILRRDVERLVECIDERRERLRTLDRMGRI